jgi:hypothetical protein
MTSYIGDDRPGHVFISYIRADRQRVDRLQDILKQAGFNVWRDTGSLRPGQDWRIEIRRAIMSGSLAFIACFSEHTDIKGMSYMNEELLVAVEQMRRRPPGRAWLIPVRFAECTIPIFDLGANRTLESLHHVDLFDGSWEYAFPQLIGAVVSILQDQTKLAQPVPGKALDVIPQPAGPVLQVRPRFIDLGIMKYYSIYHAYIEVAIGGAGDRWWDYEISGDAIKAHRLDKGILLIVRQRSGEIHASVRIWNNAEEVTVEISGECKDYPDGEPSSGFGLDMETVAPGYPPSVTEEQARAILGAWQSDTPGIPTDLFDGTLEIGNATSARLRVSHIFEYRREYEIESAKAPAAEYRAINLVRSPISWNDQSLERALAGSKKTVPCKNCMATGSVRCKKCNGIGGRLCPPTVACTLCNGTGRRADSTRCQFCNGSGTKKCGQCNGSGRIECTACKASGQQRCGNCVGSGSLVRYKRGTVSRAAKVESMRTEQYMEAAAVVARATQVSYQDLVLRHELVNELPAALHKFYSDEIDSSWKPEEVARMARLDILQAVSIAYQYGDYRGTAYLIGRKRALSIDLSKRDRRQLRLISAGSRYNLVKLSIRNATSVIKSSAKTNVNSARARWTKGRKNSK